MRQSDALAVPHKVEEEGPGRGWGPLRSNLSFR